MLTSTTARWSRWMATSLPTRATSLSASADRSPLYEQQFQAKPCDPCICYYSTGSISISYYIICHLFSVHFSGTTRSWCSRGSLRRRSRWAIVSSWSPLSRRHSRASTLRSSRRRSGLNLMWSPKLDWSQTLISICSTIIVHERVGIALYSLVLVASIRLHAGRLPSRSYRHCPGIRTDRRRRDHGAPRDRQGGIHRQHGDRTAGGTGGGQVEPEARDARARRQVALHRAPRRKLYAFNSLQSSD